MRVLVTGGAGFIGSNFARMFALGHFQAIDELIVLDKLTYAGNIKNLEILESAGNYSFVKGDICDAQMVENLVSKVDAVLNFAAESHVDRSISNPMEFVNTNVVGVLTILEAIRKTGGDKRYLQVSTDEVYGSISDGSWTEEYPLAPNSPYSASKASADLLALAYNHTYGTDVLITRCSNNYGTHHFPEKLIPLFVTNLIQGKKVPVYGTGGNIRDWLHVSDHCRGIYLALTKGISGEIYNIGGGRELTNLEITHIILDLMHCDESQIAYVEDRKGHDLRYSVDWSKAAKELGYEPKVDFIHGIVETISWYEQNPDWWLPLKSR